MTVYQATISMNIIVLVRVEDIIYHSTGLCCRTQNSV